MNEGLISKRYAKALYGHAAQMGEEQTLYQCMDTLLHCLRTLPAMHETLCSPMVSMKEKETLLRHIADTNSYRNFVQLVLTNRREKWLKQIALSYAEHYLKKKRITIVRLTLAETMPPEILTRMQTGLAKTTNSHIELSVHIDPGIRGGFIFQINDRRLDASVTGQLEQLRKQILQENKYSLHYE